MIKLEEYYNTNKDFKDYVDKYSNEHNITIHEAFKHAIVYYIYKYYKSIEKPVV